MTPQEIFEILKASSSGGILSLEGEGSDSVIWIKQSALFPAVSECKRQGFNMLVDLTAVDFSRFRPSEKGVPSQYGKQHDPSYAAGPRPVEPNGSPVSTLGVPKPILDDQLPPADSVKNRFKLSYRMMRLDAAAGLVDCRIALHFWFEPPGPPSVRGLFANADWLERELWDMFGITFPDRPGIKRLLMYEEFQGHPLRKDYPINKRQPLIGPTDVDRRDRMLEKDLRPRIA